MKTKEMILYIKQIVFVWKMISLVNVEGADRQRRISIQMPNATNNLQVRLRWYWSSYKSCATKKVNEIAQLLKFVTKQEDSLMCTSIDLTTQDQFISNLCFLNWREKM